MNAEEITKEVRNEFKQEPSILTNFEINKLERSRYINPFRITFIQNDCKRIWDGVSFYSFI